MFAEHIANICPKCCTVVGSIRPRRLRMATLAPDYVSLTRICEFARRLHQLHRVGDDNSIDREFSAVCRAIWGFTLDDFTDDDLSAEDQDWLAELTRECAIDFAAEQGYDLKDSRAGSNMNCSRLQRRRARATSGRCCSAA